MEENSSDQQSSVDRGLPIVHPMVHFSTYLDIFGGRLREDPEEDSMER